MSGMIRLIGIVFLWAISPGISFAGDYNLSAIIKQAEIGDRILQNGKIIYKCEGGIIDPKKLNQPITPENINYFLDNMTFIFTDGKFHLTRNIFAKRQNRETDYSCELEVLFDGNMASCQQYTLDIHRPVESVKEQENSKGQLMWRPENPSLFQTKLRSAWIDNDYELSWMEDPRYWGYYVNGAPVGAFLKGEYKNRNFSSVEVSGAEKIGRDDCITVTATEDNIRYKVWLSKKNYYRPCRTELIMGDTNVRIEVQHKKIDGIYFPETITFLSTNHKSPGSVDKRVIKTTKVSLNNKNFDNEMNFSFDKTLKIDDQRNPLKRGDKAFSDMPEGFLLNYMRSKIVGREYREFDLGQPPKPFAEVAGVINEYARLNPDNSTKEMRMLTVYLRAFMSDALVIKAFGRLASEGANQDIKDQWKLMSAQAYFYQKNNEMAAKTANELIASSKNKNIIFEAGMVLKSIEMQGK